MIAHDHKKRVLDKLRNACHEVEDALKLSVPAARYDPVVIPHGTRSELSGLVENLARIVQNLEGMQ
jgi:hypothetical protein